MKGRSDFDAENACSRNADLDMGLSDECMEYNY